mgnify:CR=1 FL=1
MLESYFICLQLRQGLPLTSEYITLRVLLVVMLVSASQLDSIGNALHATYGRPAEWRMQQSGSKRQAGGAQLK